MNYFAHGRAFVDEPYFLAGTAVPDWLSVVDRRVRARSARAAAWIDDPDPRVAALARGMMRHHQDDARFHATRAFGELSWQFTAAVRAAVGPDDSLRPSFLGHILVELLLDDVLIRREPTVLDRYYEAVARVDPLLVQELVNRVSPQPTDRLPWMLSMFCRERFLCDYAEDGKLIRRLNQVLSRVRLPPLPESFASMLPAAREQIGRRADELLVV